VIRDFNRWTSARRIAATSAGIITFCLVVQVFSAPSRAAQDTSRDADRYFAPDHLLDIAIEIPADDWTQLCKQSRDFGSAFGNPADKPFTYFKGNISIDGMRIESVGIRKKGFLGSLDDVRPSLKISFDEYVNQTPVKGFAGLTLNNNKQDGSQVSQLLTYQLFNSAGVVAPRCNFARVTVNGTYLGIYSNVETIGKTFLKRRFGDSSGNLFEGTISDFYPSALHRLEAKGDETETTRTRALQLSKLLASPDELPLDKIAELVDLDYFFNYWAIESLIGFWDGYTSNQNNYWVYENPKNGKFYFVPWGADASFAGIRPPFGFSNTQKATCIYAESMLANRLYHADGMAERYRTAMLGVLDTAWKEDELLDAIDAAERLIGEHLHQRQSFTPRAMNNTRNFIRTRREKVLKEFEEWPVAVPTTPRKPMYTVDVGTARGTFSTEWHDKAPDKPVETGTAKIELELDGKVIKFEKLGVQGGPNRMPFGGGMFGRAEPQAGFVFTGIRSPDSETLTLTLWVDRKTFADGAGKSIPLQGMLVVGKGGFNFFNPSANRSLTGELKLTKVGTTDGDSLAGEIDLKILENRGGFMVGRGELGTPKAGASKP
jgi:spore coat protein CotH